MTDHEADRGPAAIVRTLFERLAEGRFEELAELYAHDVRVVNRFAPDGPSTAVGREAAAGFFGFLATQVASLRTDGVVLLATTDPEVVVVEFEWVGRGRDGAGFALPGIFVVRARDGLIVESHDHLGPRRAVGDAP